MKNIVLSACAAACLALSAPAFAVEGGQQQTPAAAPASADAAAATYTDAQLRAFIAASAEINPVMQSANGAALTPQQIETVRGALTRHQLDSATYNAIAQRARSDEALAQRIETLRAPTPAAPGANPAPNANPQPGTE